MAAIRYHILVFIFLLLTSAFASAKPPGFYVEGRHLYSPCGEKVVLYGINKMIYWVDRDGIPTYAEIAKTGANVVRIQWLMPGTAEELDTAIANALEQKLIPMIELHDATGKWWMLPQLVDYWVRPDILAVLEKYEHVLLINIGNEVGDRVSASDFRSGYIEAVRRMREAGIQTPLIIDAVNYGHNIDMLQSEGPAIIDADPERNIMFSVHMWWPYMWGYSDQRVIDEIEQSVSMNLPLIIGEFANRWDMTDGGRIPYKTIIEQAIIHEVGYLPWSWGPGNSTPHMDMTEDTYFDTLHDWGLEVAVTSPYSIQNNSIRPDYILNGAYCEGAGSSSSTSSSSSSSSISSSSSVISSSSSSSIFSSSSNSSSSSSPATLVCEHVITNHWNSGFTAAMRIRNTGNATVNGWRVSWQYTDGSKRTGGWNANVTGSPTYTATPLSWNARIQPGQTIEFGVQGTKGANNAPPPSVMISACSSQ